MGKIIGGGLPVGAIGGKAEIMDHFAPDGPLNRHLAEIHSSSCVASQKCMRDNPYPLLDQLGSRVKQHWMKRQRKRYLSCCKVGPCSHCSFRKTCN